MPSSPARFAPEPAALARLVTRFPLAWLAVTEEQGMEASLVPLIARFNDDGGIVGFTGHLARGAALTGRLARQGTGAALFTGPQAYISPSWFADRTQAPTWNYASARFQLRLELIEDAAWIAGHLTELSEVHEAGRPAAWSPVEMGARFGRLSRGVVGFVAEVTGVEAVFKLGQDERQDVLSDIDKALATHGPAELLEWVRESNRGRG